MHAFSQSQCFDLSLDLILDRRVDATAKRSVQNNCVPPLELEQCFQQVQMVLMERKICRIKNVAFRQIIFASYLHGRDGTLSGCMTARRKRYKERQHDDPL